MTEKSRRQPKGKGEFGYFRSEKKRRFLVTIGLFILPAAVLIFSWIYFGSRNNVWTVICAVGCLPGCRSLVNLIMILKCRPMDRSVYDRIKAHQGGLTMAYEMYMTFYEKSAYIDAVAVCGNTVVGYSSDPRIDTSYMASHAQNLVWKNGYKIDFKLLTDLRMFLERLDSMNAHSDSLQEGIRFTPDEKYPELSRNELVRQSILALCL